MSYNVEALFLCVCIIMLEILRNLVLFLIVQLILSRLAPDSVTGACNYVSLYATRIFQNHLSEILL